MAVTKVAKAVGRMSKIGFSAAKILVPRAELLPRWSVVACDQYTSDPEYWARTERSVGDAPSTFRMIYPEVYLDEADGAARIAAIHGAMRDYLTADVLCALPEGFVYVERTLASGKIRHGLVGKLDLEAYDYTAGTRSPVRPTEGTVESRLPPRVKVREGASLETPHIMVLLDDAARGVIEALAAHKTSLAQVYDTPLMENGGRVAGWLVEGEEAARLDRALDGLARRLEADNAQPLLIAAGDGNHSLATAKAYYEQLKKTLPAAQLANHPARWALVELLNLHDDALEFEPIHRVVFGVDPSHLLETFMAIYSASTAENGGQSVDFVAGERRGKLFFGKPASRLVVGTLQKMIDAYLAEFGGTVDYIHGDTVAEGLATRPDAVAFLLPVMDKSELFPTVMQDGALPRKTFSLGHAHDKRFYLECRAIVTQQSF